MADKTKNQNQEVADQHAENIDDNGTEENKQNKLNPKLNLIIVSLSGVVLIGGIIGILYLMGVFGTIKNHKKSATPTLQKHVEQLEDILTYEIHGLLVNLKSESKRQTSYLKLAVGLETVVGSSKESDKDTVKAQIGKLEPYIKDQFYSYLRELELSDLQGSAGMQRLREELLDRANAIAKPLQFSNILFLEFLIQ